MWIFILIFSINFPWPIHYGFTSISIFVWAGCWWFYFIIVSLICILPIGMLSFTFCPPLPHFSQWNYWEKYFFFPVFLTYGLNICVPQISNIEIMSPQGDDIKSWAFGIWSWTWRRISALLTVAPKRSFASSIAWEVRAKSGCLWVRKQVIIRY